MERAGCDRAHRCVGTRYHCGIGFGSNRSGGRDMLWGCKGTDGKTLSEVKDHTFKASSGIWTSRCARWPEPFG